MIFTLQKLSVCRRLFSLAIALAFSFALKGKVNKVRPVGLETDFISLRLVKCALP